MNTYSDAWVFKFFVFFNSFMKGILQLFFQFILSYKFSLFLMLCNSNPCLDNHFFKSWWLNFCYIFVCIIDPLNESVNNIFVDMINFMVIDMKINYNLFILYHLVGLTWIISVYFEKWLIDLFSSFGRVVIMSLTFHIMLLIISGIVLIFYFHM